MEGGDAGRYSPVMNNGHEGRIVIKPAESVWRSAGGVPPDRLNYNIKKQFMLSPKNTKYCSLKKNLFHKSKSALQIFENKYIQEQVNLRKRKIISDDNDI